MLRESGCRIDAGNFKRKSDDERRTNGRMTVHGDGSVMFVDDHVVRDRQTLSRAFAHLFGGKERIKDPIFDIFSDAAAGVLDTDLGPVRVFSCRYPVGTRYVGETTSWRRTIGWAYGRSPN